MTGTCEPAAEAAGDAHQRPAANGWNLEARLARSAPADAIVLFATAGGEVPDEAAAALYGMARHGHLTMPVGVVHPAGTNLDAVKTRIECAVEPRRPVDRHALARVTGALRSLDLDGPAIGQRPLYYLALPPSELAAVLDAMRRSSGAPGARALLDKPFGYDLRTARVLNQLVDQVFRERDVFRVDHHLPDERLYQLLSFRQSHPFVEPLWNRHHVESVQITIADSSGPADPARYDRVGAIRDAVQSDALHLMASLAMDLPVGADSAVIQNERGRLLKAVRPASSSDLFRGQFRGYQQEPLVRRHSSVETFAALRLSIDSERWAGVPFHIRAGKRLAATATEIVVRFRPAPGAAGGRVSDAGFVRFRFLPAASIEVVTPALTRRPSEPTVEYGAADRPRNSRSLLEDLFTDAIRGKTARFAARGHIEDAWRIVSPLLDDESPVYAYESGSWGPAPVNRAIVPAGGWVNPLSPVHAADRTLSRSAQAARS